MLEPGDHTGRDTHRIEREIVDDVWGRRRSWRRDTVIGPRLHSRADATQHTGIEAAKIAETIAGAGRTDADYRCRYYQKSVKLHDAAPRFSKSIRDNTPLRARK